MISAGSTTARGSSETSLAGESRGDNAFVCVSQVHGFTSTAPPRLLVLSCIVKRMARVISAGSTTALGRSEKSQAGRGKEGKCLCVLWRCRLVVGLTGYCEGKVGQL